MAIEIITGFDPKKKSPLDERAKVADQTARLALAWYYKGLRVRQTDDNHWYEYVGDETTNIAGDWRQITQVHRGNGAPANSLGFIDDTYIDELNRVYYLKTGVSTWANKFTF